MRDHLRYDSVRARANILRATGHTRAAVPQKFYGGFGLSARRDPGTGGHAPAERYAFIVLHGTDGRFVTGPAKFLSPSCQAFLQVTR